MLEAEYVFLDTNVFVRSNFDFSNRVFEIFADYVDRDLFQLVLTDINVSEVQRHIRRNIEGSREAFNAFHKTVRILANCRDPRFDLVREKKLDYQVIHEEILEQWKSFLTRTNATVLPVDGSKTGEVFERYFEGQAPFGPHGKKDEFPDAFALATLETWLGGHATGSGRLYIVSEDGLVGAYCTGHPSLIHVASFTELLALAAKHVEEVQQNAKETEHDEILEAFQEWLESSPEDVTSAISDAFELLGFELDQFEGDVETVTVQRVEVNSARIIALDGERQHGTAVVNATVDYKAEVIYPDPEHTFTDKESGYIVVFDMVNAKLERWEELDFQVEFVIPEGVFDAEKIEVVSVELQSADDVTVCLDGW